MLDAAGGESSSEAISIEMRLADLIARRRGGIVCLCGAPGSGKSIAIEHLAATLPDDAGVVLRDENHVLAHHQATMDGSLVVCSSRTPSTRGGSVLAVLRMAPWTRDDVIEYVLATAGPSANTVLKRVLASEGIDRLDGSPELWRVVLDEMTADPELCDVRGTLLGWLRKNVAAWEAACTACFDSLCAPPADQTASRKPLWKMEDQPVIRQPCATLLLAGQKVASELTDVETGDLLTRTLPPELIAEAGKLARARPGAVEHLRQIAEGPLPAKHATAATILVTAEPAWRPAAGTGPRLPRLAGARLGAVRWNGVQLPRVDLERANLQCADLSGARLEKSVLSGAAATRANLRCADLREARAQGANFTGADFWRAILTDAVLEDCDLTRARLDFASLAGAEMESAVLRGASLCTADLSGASMGGVVLDDADLTDANLAGALLTGVRLSAAASLNGANFRGAVLSGGHLENVKLDEPNFGEALLINTYLTASVMRNPRFMRADLRGAGLAEIDWENADLRSADLRGASFHMGTTRSGMVNCDVPCEGSRTGFYTDDFADRDFRAPEDIRKANLCGADLRGARIEGVDFYLVDLRGAKYDIKQADHLLRCGAILKDWVA